MSESRTTTTRAWMVPTAIAGVVASVVALHLVYPDGNLGELTYLGVLVGAGIAAVFGAIRRSPEERGPWLWVAAGVGLSGLGDLSYSIYMHVHGFEPDVSIADVPWLASYVAISIGLLMLLRATRRGDRSDVDGMIDMAVVGVVSLLVVWQIALQATVNDSSVALNVRVVWGAYPILDAALLALVVRTIITRTPGARLLAAGVACWLVSDLLYMLFPGSSTWAVWLDAGWMVGAALLAAATWPRARRITPVRRREEVGAGRVALAIVPLLVPGIIEVVAYGSGVDPNPVPMLAASVVLAGLAFARALRLLRNTSQARSQVLAAEHLFRALVQRSSDAALVFDADGRVVYVSPAALDVFGYRVEDLIGQQGPDLVHPDDVQAARRVFVGVAETFGNHATAEFRIRDAAGEWRWVEEVVTNLLDEPSVCGLVVNVRDISSRRASEEEMYRLAYYDHLTGLPNRRLLTQMIDEALATTQESIALLVIDIDQFKFVNDSRGHATGDQLLAVLADRLRATLPTTDAVGRIGGDEFGVICHDVHGLDAVHARADLIGRTLGDSVDLKVSGTFTISASVGIAISSARTTSEQLLQQADTAMYAAKRQGPGQYVTFDEQLRDRVEEQLTLQADLRRALARRELTVHYQPVVDLASGHMDGVEALVRWRHPTRGLVMPGDFIPLAEQSDLIDGIGAFVLEQACADASWWARAGHPLSVAVNISGAQLRHENLASTIQTALYDSGLSPDLLTLEITETALMRGAEVAMDNVLAIRRLGVSVALDDFGTGYSSLSYLKRVPADIVKIDRLFVTDIAENKTDRDITEAIIRLAHALGRSVVAEGVETEAQRAVLERLGCTLAQGYLWSSAVPVEQVLNLRSTFADKDRGLLAVES